jgi:hypothetical protein
MPEQVPATLTASLASVQAAFDALLAPTGFQRTRKMLWVQRHAHTASFVLLQREGAGRAPIDTSLALRLQAGIRVLDSDFPALALNGPDSQDAVLTLRESRFHLRFNLASGHGRERCLADLERYTAEVLQPWFARFAAPEALLVAPSFTPAAGLQRDAALNDDDKVCLRHALQHGADPARLAASLKLLGIKTRA